MKTTLTMQYMSKQKVSTLVCKAINQLQSPLCLPEIPARHRVSYNPSSLRLSTQATTLPTLEWFVQEFATAAPLFRRCHRCSWACSCSRCSGRIHGCFPCRRFGRNPAGNRLDRSRPGHIRPGRSSGRRKEKSRKSGEEQNTAAWTPCTCGS